MLLMNGLIAFNVNNMSLGWGKSFLFIQLLHPRHLYLFFSKNNVTNGGLFCLVDLLGVYPSGPSCVSGAVLLSDVLALVVIG